MDEVEIVNYDPRWPVLFDEEAKRLRAVLDPSSIVGLEHFGSTAVPGLSAKPIIDILMAVRSLRDVRKIRPALESAGARYLARGGAHKVYEGDWEPRRIVLLQFPSVEAWEAFYNGPTYQGLKAIRDAC